MNERIMKLAIQAREYAESKPDIYAVAYDKKFAELIVRECAQVCAKIELDEELSAEADIWDGAMMCRVEIMEHFGVEE